MGFPAENFMTSKSFGQIDSHYIVHSPQYHELANINISDDDMTEDFAGFIDKLPYSEELIKYEG